MTWTTLSSVQQRSSLNVQLRLILSVELGVAFALILA